MAKTVELLRRTELAIASFRILENRLPSSHHELRLFLNDRGIDYVPYDHFGLRLQYRRLSEDEFIIRSFSSQQSTAPENSQQGLAVVKMTELARKPMSQTKADHQALNLFPAYLLEGNSAWDSDFYAGLITDPADGSKHVVIRDYSRPHFVMTSFHDAAREFLWLGKDLKLTYTASGSSRYQDGVYIWDTMTNETVNVLPTIKEHFFPDIEKFFLALSSSDFERETFFVLVKPMDEAVLDPRQFYHHNNLFKVELRPSLTVTRSSGNMSLFESPLPVWQSNQDPDGLAIQKQWLKLARKGQVTDVVSAWQDFAAKHSQSLSFSYSLWWLASLYSDAAQALAVQYPQDSSVLRSYGIEIAQTLDEQIEAPFYLRSMGLFLRQRLENGQFSGYTVAKFQ